MIEIFKANFSQEEITLILDLDNRFPARNIVSNFEFFLNQDPELRPAIADERSKKVLRTGWGQVGVPLEDLENIHEHTEDMKVMAEEGIPDHPELAYTIGIIHRHDKTETITSDFTPRDGVSKDEKYKIELMAAKVIWQAKPEEVQYWLDFEECSKFSARFAKDMDVAQMFKRAIRYTKSHPQANMGEHIPYCQNFGYKTAEGRKVFEQLNATLTL